MTNPFKFTANTSFDAATSSNDNQEGIVDSISDIVSTIFVLSGRGNGLLLLL